MKLPDPLTRRRLTLALVGGWSAVILGVFVLGHAPMVQPLGSFLGTLGTAFSTAFVFHVCGWRIFRSLRPFFSKPVDALELFAIEMGLGLGVAMLGLFVMGVLGLYVPIAAMVFLAALALTLGDPRTLVRDLAARWAGIRDRLSQCAPSERFFGLLVVIVTVMTGLESLTPETSQDALVYHLAAPDLYVQSGGIHFIPGNFYASFPQNVEMIYTLALLLGDSSLAAWYHWWLGIGAALAVACLARRASGGHGGLAAAAVFVTIPSAALVSTWAYVEMGWIFFQMLAVLCFLAWRRDGSRGWIVLAGIFAGLAAGCKYTGGSIGIIVLGLILFLGRPELRGWRPRLVLGTIFSLVVAMVVSPWLIKNIVCTGNPLYPFLHGLFGGRDWDAERAAAFGMFLNNWGHAGGLGDWLMLPLDLTFGARFSSIESFDGVIGPAFLLGAPLVLVGMRRNENLILLTVISGVLGFLWLVMTHQIRFLLPTLACLAAAIGGGMPHVLGGRALTLGRVVLGGALLVNVTLIGWHFVSHNPLPVVLGLEREESYLTREIPCGDYPVFLYIDHRLPADAKIYMAASGNPGFLCRRSYFMDALFENHTLKQILRRAEDSDAVYARFREGGFSHVLFRSELIFDSDGLRSGLERPEQKRFASFLNGHTKLEFAHAGTSLYRLVEEASPESSGGTP